MQLTATEWVECRCTMAPESCLRSYTAMCRKASLVGLWPDIQFPLRSSREMFSGSISPMELPVGVISQPSSRRTLMLPLLPKVNPRSYKDRASFAILSLCWVSFMAAWQTPWRKSPDHQNYRTSGPMRNCERRSRLSTAPPDQFPGIF